MNSARRNVVPVRPRPLQWTFSERKDHLEIVCTGQWHVRSILRLIDESGRKCKESFTERVFCDMTRVRGLIPELDRYVSGLRTASVLGGQKIAVLASSEAVITQFAAAVATKRGARVFVTANRAAAREWLFS